MVDQVLQNWGHYGKGWGLVSSNWHPLLPGVGKRGSLLFSVILEPSDTESEKEEVVEDVKEENVEVAIFEEYF